MIFASNTQLQWLGKATRIHGDGTFESWPKLFYQLRTVSYMNDIEFKKWLNSLGALALIPREDIDQAWEIIKSNKPTNLDVNPIINYFNKTWLTGKK